MASTVQEVDNGLYRVIWLVEIKSSLEIKRLSFRLDRLPPNTSYDVFAFCSFNSEQQQQQPDAGKDSMSRSFEFRFRFWEVDAAKKLNKDSSRYSRGKLASVWATVNGGRRHDLKLFPGGSWNSEGFEVVEHNHANDDAKPAWLVEVHLWLQFEVADRGETKLLNQLADLLVNQSNCDVRFVFRGGEQIGAHALVLGARSPVFDAMFRYDTKEALSRTVAIEDVQADTFRFFLHYIYRGRLPEPLAEDTVEHVYMAADKYAIDDLKAECADWMLEHVRVENAVQLLAWAHVHSIEPVKEAALDFIAQHGKEICPLPDWEELIKNYPDLSLVASRRMMENMVLVQSK